MSGRPRHPSKEIEAAISHLESLGWTWKAPGKSSHCWGRMMCEQHDRTGCIVSVWSTPRSAQNHANQLRGHGKNCAHKAGKEAKNEDV
ncbi:MAG: hypothetical protein E5Y85_28615 [Mesorhizobium sp.]|nr:MAG: hypothetical protein E5Y85_28615 [Mesorhizobium sp.]